MLEQLLLFMRFHIPQDFSRLHLFTLKRFGSLKYLTILFYFLNIAHVEETRNSNINLVLNLKERSRWADLNEDGKIILKLILNGNNM